MGRGSGEERDGATPRRQVLIQRSEAEITVSVHSLKGRPDWKGGRDAVEAINFDLLRDEDFRRPFRDDSLEIDGFFDDEDEPSSEENRAYVESVKSILAEDLAMVEESFSAAFRDGVLHYDAGDRHLFIIYGHEGDQLPAAVDRLTITDVLSAVGFEQ